MRIGIVNDMPLAREALRRVVVSTLCHQVAWLANNGKDSIAQACRDTPDLILMDLIMPGTDGVEATRRIMAESPCPILVVTATVSGTCCKVYEAMGHGALDAVDTPTLGPRGDVNGAEALLAKIAMIAKLTGKSDCRTTSATIPRLRRPSARFEPPLVAIGCSTGGPSALADILLSFPQNWGASVVLIQHVDVAFATGLARWLTEMSGHHVRVAENGDQPEPGTILLAATNDHLALECGSRLRYVSEPRDFCYRPSVDVFFASVAAHWPGTGVGVVLTGMGRDGAAGLLSLRRAGWLTIAQDAATCVVWGMPRAAAEAGGAVEVLPLPKIGPRIVDQVEHLVRNAGGSS